MRRQRKRYSIRPLFSWAISSERDRKASSNGITNREAIEILCLIPTVAKASAHIHNITFNLIFLVVAGVVSALACGIGAIAVFFLGNRITVWRPLLEGMTAGLMTAASVEGLIRPALKVGGILQTGLGFFIGVLFLLVLRQLMRSRQFEVGNLRGAGVRRSALVFAVLFIHSLPEGMAMGAAQASGVQGLNIFVLAAIALQNVP